MKLADLERHPGGHGCLFHREGGAHTIWFNPVTRKIASVPRYREIKEGTARAICRQLEIPKPEGVADQFLSSAPLRGQKVGNPSQSRVI